jgi:hypothetical protein
MKNKYKKIHWKRVAKLPFIVLILFNVLAPVIFVWLVEIGMDFKEDVYYTNGFWNTSSMKMYHLALNFMINITFFTSAIIFYNLEKILT